ncbi:MAG: hypothetical protein K6G18_12485 [Treponema sp.]|nr:hypothetical protein [Treponema sp.]
MLDSLEADKSERKEDVLCGKSDTIDMDIPSQDMTITLNYIEYEKAVRHKEGSSRTDIVRSIPQFLVVQNSSAILTKQKEAVESELAVFVSENSDLAMDARFCDNYYYRLSGFYALTGNYEKEKECLSHIKDRKDSVYAARIAENELRMSEHTEENLSLLYNINTSETARKLSGFYIARKEFGKAEDALKHYIREHDEPPYDIYFQYAFLSMQTGDADKAIHFLRLSFYTQGTAQAALALSMIYLALSTQDTRLYKKALRWCLIAVGKDVSFTPALRLFVNMTLESNPWRAEQILSRYLALNGAHGNAFYFDAAINYARCAFVMQKYGTALERLSELPQDATNPAAVWNNIAVCNEALGKLDRAERNIAKSLEKENSGHKQTILANYMRILNRQKKYGQTLSLFEGIPGAKEFELTEDSYQDYFSYYRDALRETGNYGTCHDFLLAAFTNTTADSLLKLFACNDLLRLIAVSGEFSTDALTCLEFLKELHKNKTHERYMAKILNNIVYTSLELGIRVETEVLHEFRSTLAHAPCNTATYGLYLLRTRHDAQRGLAYYDRAIAMSMQDPDYANVTGELRIKKDLEAARESIFSGDTKAARRLLESLGKRCPKSLQGYRQAAARLMEEC